MNEDKASRYQRLARRARFSRFLVSAALLIGVLLSPLSISLRDCTTNVAAWLGASSAATPPLVVACYVLFLAALHEGFTWPLEYYRGYVLESRFGLSTQRAGQWLVAHVKAALVGLVLAELAAGILYALIRFWPRWWWAAAAAIFALLTAWLARVGPVLILPLFYQCRPLERDALQQRLVSLARRAGTTALGAYGWTLSDSTRKASAALVGLGRTRRILLSDTLISNYSDDEVEVVLAHELAHHLHGDIWRGLAFDTLMSVGTFYVAHRALLVAGPLAGIAGPSDVAGLPLILLVSGGLSLLVLPLANALSREQERRADRFALRLTGNPGAFASAMRRLAQQNLAEEHPPRVVQTLFGSHPPVAERLQLARDEGAAFGARSTAALDSELAGG
jgi:Zn-dependent protease with chaperone function